MGDEQMLAEPLENRVNALGHFNHIFPWQIGTL
jgi:hypothetical protein